jgi:hypothetical protein
MKKFIKIQLALVIVFALGFSSCSKKDSTPQKPNNQTLLTAKTWSLIKIASDDNDNGKIEDSEFQSLPANSTYYISFLNDGTLTSVIKSDNVNVTVTYNWQLQDDQQTIKIFNAAGSATYYWHIKKLTSTEFNFEEYQADNMSLDSGNQCVPK